MASQLDQDRIRTFEKLHKAFLNYGRKFCRNLLLCEPGKFEVPGIFSLDDHQQASQGSGASYSYELYGEVILPSFDAHKKVFERSLGSHDLRPISCDVGDQIMAGTHKHVQVICIVDKSSRVEVAASERFLDLCHRAGAALSRDFMSNFPFGEEISRLPPTSRFLNTMFWSRPFDLNSIRFLQSEGYVFWTHDQYVLASETLEDCGLTTEAPRVTRPNTVWPSWAGSLPLQMGTSGPPISQSIDDPASSAIVDGTEAHPDKPPIDAKQSLTILGPGTADAVATRGTMSPPASTARDTELTELEAHFLRASDIEPFRRLRNGELKAFFDKARPKSRGLFVYLFGCPGMRARRQTALSRVWDEPVTDDALRKNIVRLNEDIVKHAKTHVWTCEKNDDEVWLERTKKGQE